MASGYSGIFVIPWSQTELDGVRAPKRSALHAGAAWSWRGEALRMDGPQTLLRLTGSEPTQALRLQARKRLGAEDVPDFEREPLLSRNFTITDGRSSYVLAVIENGAQPLLVCYDGLPPEDTEMWVVRQSLDPVPQQGVDMQVTGLCHLSLITTPSGPTRANRLRPGDLVQTRDHGAQPLRWVGSLPVSQARLMLAPHLGPKQVRQGGHTVNVAPSQHIAVCDSAARALFNTDDVLMEAQSLGTKPQIASNPLRYVLLFFDTHEIITANGIDLASFHPADLPLNALAPVDRTWLEAAFPDVAQDPFIYGPHARRRLTAPEVSLLRAA